MSRALQQQYRKSNAEMSYPHKRFRAPSILTVTASTIFFFPFVTGCYAEFRIPAAAVFSTSHDTLKIKSLVHHSSDPRPRSAEIPGYTSATVPGDEPAAAERPAAPCAELRVTSRLGRPPTFLECSTIRFSDQNCLTWPLRNPARAALRATSVRHRS